MEDEILLGNDSVARERGLQDPDDGVLAFAVGGELDVVMGCLESVTRLVKGAADDVARGGGGGAGGVEGRGHVAWGALPAAAVPVASGTRSAIRAETILETPLSSMVTP